MEQVASAVMIDTAPPQPVPGDLSAVVPVNTPYPGLATRAVAFMLDAALVTFAAIVVAIGVALVLVLLRLPSKLDGLVGAIGAVAYVVWSIGYFAAFWSTTGQTPGAWAMRIRVAAADGKTLTVRRALARAVLLILAGLPMLLGVLPILFDPQRRGLHDWLARTVVVDAPERSAVQRRRIDGVVAARISPGAENARDHQ